MKDISGSINHQRKGNLVKKTTKANKKVMELATDMQLILKFMSKFNRIVFIDYFEEDNFGFSDWMDPDLMDTVTEDGFVPNAVGWYWVNTKSKIASHMSKDRYNQIYNIFLNLNNAAEVNHKLGNSMMNISPKVEFESMLWSVVCKNRQKKMKNNPKGNTVSSVLAMPRVTVSIPRQF